MVNSQNRYEISVIIPTYNRSSLLEYSLTSLLKQNIEKSSFEVIVADDGSSDDTRNTVLRFEPLMNIKYLFQEDRGYRPGSARNMGVLAAEGKICVFMDSSVMLNSDCLKEHIAFYDRMKSGVAVVGYVYGFERTKESEILLKELVILDQPQASVERLASNPIFSDVRDGHYVRYNGQIHHLPAPWFYFWTCHVSALRTDLVNVGLFDHNYDGKWGVEDNDLGFRLTRNGIQIHLLRTAEAIHYPHPKDKEERRAEGYQNCVYFHDKFKSPETQVFLENYMNDQEFVDINKILLETHPLYKPPIAVVRDICAVNVVKPMHNKVLKE